jgi:hypothetical protein
MFAGEGNEQAFSYSMQELTFLASDMRELRQAEKEREMFA